MKNQNKQLRLSDAITKKTIFGMLMVATIVSLIVAALAVTGFFYLQAKRETDLLSVVQRNMTDLVQNDDYAEVERELASFLTAAPESNIFVMNQKAVTMSLPDRSTAGKQLAIKGLNLSSTATLGSDYKLWAKIDLIDHRTMIRYGSIAMSLPLSPIVDKGWIIFFTTFSVLFLVFIIWAKVLKIALDQALSPIKKLYDDLLCVGSGKKPRHSSRDFEILELAEMSKSISKTYDDVTFLTEEAAKKEGEKRAKESMHSLLHDLSNPIQAQTNLISTFIEHPDDEDIKTLIKEQGPILEEQIGHLMDMTRHLEIENPNMTLADIIKTVEVGAKAGAVAKPSVLKVRKSNAQNDHAMVGHDSGLISRAIANLVRNSVEEGATQVEVWCEPKDLKIHIKDNGPGIPQEKLTLLFESRLKSSKPNGSGVGFPTAMRLVKSHQGKILYSKDITQGAHFIIELGNLRGAV